MRAMRNSLERAAAIAGLLWLVGHAAAAEVWLGVGASPTPPEVRAHLPLSGSGGLVVDVVAARSPAADAGVERYDVLTALAGRTLERPADIAAVLQGRDAGERIDLVLLRNARPLRVVAQLAHRPVEARAATAVALPAFAMPWALSWSTGDVRYGVHVDGPQGRVWRGATTAGIHAAAASSAAERELLPAGVRLILRRMDGGDEP